MKFNPWVSKEDVWNILAHLIAFKILLNNPINIEEIEDLITKLNCWLTDEEGDKKQ